MAMASLALSAFDGNRPRVPNRKSHYRPFSQLIEVDVAEKALKRSSMNLHFKAAKKEQPSTRLLSPDVPTSSGRVKKKRSIASLFSDSSSPPSTATADQEPESSPFFVPKSVWAKRNNMKLHPYQKDTPYMQAYDPILLESDRYSDLLLQRLANGSPSFHDYGKKPPATILDLGCGQGHWVLHAANIWKSSRFTAMDLVNIVLPAFETTENACFVQGDFLAYKLPFPDRSFEYVRMANLVLCIPYPKWTLLVNEVFRVLTVGGRLELIDDQIYFPYGQVPKDAPLPCSSKSLWLFDEDEDRRCEDSSGSSSSSSKCEAEDNDTELTSLGSEGGSNPSSFEDKPCLSESATVRPLAAYLPPTPECDTPTMFMTPRPAPSPSSSRSTAWQRQAHASRDLETTFEKMLTDKFGIISRPSDFVLEILEKTFGKGKAGKTRSFHVKLAPAGYGADETLDDGDVDVMTSTGSFVGKEKKGWTLPKRKTKKSDKGFKEELLTTSGVSSGRSSPSHDALLSTPVPASVNAKAAGRLGLEYVPPVVVEDKKGCKEKKNPEDAALSTAATPKPVPLTVPTRTKTNLPTKSTTDAPSPQPTHGPILSAKAAGRLGISYSALAAATASSARPQSMHAPSLSSVSASSVSISISSSASIRSRAMTLSSLQSTGILIWHSSSGPTSSSNGPTYIPLSPAELEMHACKYIHTLLGCRTALGDYVARFRDERGQRYVTEDELGDVCWDYECFRRTRLNWPSEAAADGDEDEGENPYAGVFTNSPTTTSTELPVAQLSTVVASPLPMNRSVSTPSGSSSGLGPALPSAPKLGTSLSQSDALPSGPPPPRPSRILRPPPPPPAAATSAPPVIATPPPAPVPAPVPVPAPSHSNSIFSKSFKSSTKPKLSVQKTQTQIQRKHYLHAYPTHTRNSSSSSDSFIVDRDELVHIRSVRVFEATKTKADIVNNSGLGLALGGLGAGVGGGGSGLGLVGFLKASTSPKSKS